MSDEVKALTDAQLAVWKALADAATPGPWYFRTCRFGDKIETALHKGDVIDGEVRDMIIDPCNGDFIADAREAVPALIDEVERLREENEKLKTEV